MGVPNAGRRVDVGKLVEGLKALEGDVQDFNATDVPENPGFLWRLVHLNPALYRGFVVAAVMIAGAFGLAVSDNQTNAIVLALTAVAAVAQAIWTRRSVTANRKVVIMKPDPINAPTTVVPGQAVSTDTVAVLKAAATNPDTGISALPLLPGGSS